MRPPSFTLHSLLNIMILLCIRFFDNAGEAVWHQIWAFEEKKNTASKSYQLYALGSLYLFNPNKVIYARVMKSLKGS